MTDNREIKIGYKAISKSPFMKGLWHFNAVQPIRHPGGWYSPPENCGPCAVFDTKENAVAFVECYSDSNTKHRIFRCEYIESEQTIQWSIDDEINCLYLHGVCHGIWHLGNRPVNVLEPRDMPKGKVLVDCYRLLEQVY
jgi:hypothetical protein